MRRTTPFSVRRTFGTRLPCADRAAVAALAAALSVRVPAAARVGFRHHRHHGGLLIWRFGFRGEAGQPRLQWTTAQGYPRTGRHAKPSRKRGNCTTEDEPELPLATTWLVQPVQSLVLFVVFR